MFWLDFEYYIEHLVPFSEWDIFKIDYVLGTLYSLSFQRAGNGPRKQLQKLYVENSLPASSRFDLVNDRVKYLALTSSYKLFLENCFYNSFFFSTLSFLPSIFFSPNSSLITSLHFKILSFLKANFQCHLSHKNFPEPTIVIQVYVF